MKRYEGNKQVRKIAILVSCASVLQIVESLFPHPIPGIRLGLANIITLIAMVDIGFSAAIEVAVLRTVISSFILGTFLSPSFILSFSGALFSAIAMGLAYNASFKLNYVLLSITGISILGAVVHNLTQLSLVYLLLIKQKEIFMLLPWLGISAVIMGWVNGLIVSRIGKRLENRTVEAEEVKENTVKAKVFSPGKYIDSNSPIHEIIPEIKIIFVLILGMMLLFLQNVYVYMIILTFLFVINYLSGFSVVKIVSDLKRMYLFILFSFLGPLFFNSAGDVFWKIGIFKVTQIGLHTGGTFAFRVILLILSSSLLVKTTSPQRLAEGIEKVLLPLRRFGISGKRIATIITLSWDSIPAVWDRINSLIKFKRNNLVKLPLIIDELSSTILLVYRESER